MHYEVMSMSKNFTICFRTSKKLRKALEKIAADERRSISSTIENIIYKYCQITRPQMPLDD